MSREQGPEVPCHLLELPRELRDMIYDYTFRQPSGYITIEAADESTVKQLHTATALTRTCKQIREESADLLYTLNSLKVYLPCHNPKHSQRRFTVHYNFEKLFLPQDYVDRLRQSRLSPAYRCLPPMALNELPWQSIELNLGFIDTTQKNSFWSFFGYIETFAVFYHAAERIPDGKVVAEMLSDSGSLIRVVFALTSEDVVADGTLEEDAGKAFRELKAIAAHCKRSRELPFEGISIDRGVQRRAKGNIGASSVAD